MGRGERIVLGGGCFWCTEAVFNMVDGVMSVTPGYAGGSTPDPSYREVCGGETGHAEVVSVEYDPDRISLEELLDVFFASHDPTTPNRQGSDVGTQYRSIILYSSDEQKEAVGGYLESIRGDYPEPPVTEVVPLREFYPAEEYHHGYYKKNPREPYCRLVISPKVLKMRKILGSP